MSRKNILIVDDERDITNSLKLGLERRGVSVTAFNDPSLALEDSKSHSYDVLFVDVRMPSMNGFELYREIRKHDKNTRICFFTTFEINQKEFASMFPNIIGTTILKKPVTIAQLESQINELTRTAVSQVIYNK